MICGACGFDEKENMKAGGISQGYMDEDFYEIFGGVEVVRKEKGELEEKRGSLYVCPECGTVKFKERD